MEFTKEMMEKAKKAASAGELMKLAEAEGIALNVEDAKKYFAFLNPSGSAPLSDADVEAVAGGEAIGGKGSDEPTPKYSVGQRVQVYFPTSMNYIHGTINSCNAIKNYEGKKYFQYRVYVEEYQYEITLHLDDLGSDVQLI